MTTLLQALVDAAALGALFALVAMGLGLMFGVMRLINFAYGELITAGAYALALTSGQTTWARAVIAFGVVIILSVLMDVVFRPLRGATPAAMLVATFALSFTLQNIAVVVFGTRGNAIGFLPQLNQAISIGDVRIRWVTLVSIVVGAILLSLVALFLTRTTIGLQIRAAAADFQTARMLGVRTNRVIATAFVLAGGLAATVTLVLAVQRPLATPTYGFLVVIPALVGVVVGGMNRLVTATFGGFVIGMATGLFANLLPSSSRVFLNTALFALVIIVLLVKPNGLFLPGRAPAGERL